MLRELSLRFLFALLFVAPCSMTSVFGASAGESSKSNWIEAPKTGLGGATRLTPEELATGQRLEKLLGKPVRESPHVGAEYIDDLGRSFDVFKVFIGTGIYRDKQIIRERN